MKLVTAVLSFLLISGVASAQAAKSTTPAPEATQKALEKSSTPVPQLMEEEKTQILFLQRNIAETTVIVANLQKQLDQFQNQLGTLAASIQKRLGPNFTVNRDTLVVTEVPPTPAPEVKK